MMKLFKFAAPLLVMKLLSGCPESIEQDQTTMQLLQMQSMQRNGAIDPCANGHALSGWETDTPQYWQVPGQKSRVCERADCTHEETQQTPGWTIEETLRKFCREYMRSTSQRSPFD
jgi:hypothetical protein